MLLQSLLLIATLAIIGSALLTSTLVSAKSSFHALVVRQSRNAMTDATASFIAWAQISIRKNGIDQLPVWAATPHIRGPEPTCDEAPSVSSNTESLTCKLYREVTWNVTGYTSGNANQKSSPTISEAMNLAPTQNERRISATVTVTITDPTGSIAYASESRQITARVFHASPYVALTGERDASSEAGSISTSEGDTAGYLDQRIRQTPSDSIAVSNYDKPAAKSDTTLVTTIDCVDSVALGASTVQDGAAAFIPLRNYGNLVWSYETPCIPETPVNLNTAPQGYQQTKSASYGNNSTMNESWTKGDESNSTFAR